MIIRVKTCGQRIVSWKGIGREDGLHRLSLGTTDWYGFKIVHLSQLSVIQTVAVHRKIDYIFFKILSRINQILFTTLAPKQQYGYSRD